MPVKFVSCNGKQCEMLATDDDVKNRNKNKQQMVDIKHDREERQTHETDNKNKRSS